MRPNLMSPRRSSGEDSILAMLERDPARKRGAAGGSSGRLAWFGASAAVAIALTGILVWLAAGNDGTTLPHDQPVLASAAATTPGSAGRADPAPSTLPEAAPALRQVAMATASAPPRQGPETAALIVDQEPAHHVPPMRLLKPAPPRPAALPPVRVPVPVPASGPRAGASGMPAAPGPAPVAAGPSRPAARPRGAPARPRPAALARTAARPGAAKLQRSAGPAARGAETLVDADVALISAVIVHANGHAPEGSQMTELLCPNDACKAKPATQ